MTSKHALPKGSFSSISRATAGSVALMMNARPGLKANKDIGRSDMSDALVKVLRRFEERLARLESEAEAGARHWKAVHLHKALAALPDDHLAADLHLDELD